ncbi:MAG: hypothetical protein QOG80_2526 [Pseudonocardiales bacterium]|nr:hypothetical protein [Pseudonocardiales bacterium]
MIETLRPQLAELVPVVRRAVELEPAGLVRFRVTDRTVTAYVRLPFRVLVSRTIGTGTDLAPLDTSVSAAELLAWLDDDTSAPPAARDADWRESLPPVSGWQRLDRVPDDVVRGLVRSGATALKDAAAREGVPGAQPRAEVADALLDAVVLTVTNDAGRTARVALRTVSSLVRMGFVPRGSEVSVDVSGRWTRISGDYGSAYAQEPGGLALAST